MFPVDKLSSYERGYLYNVIRFTHICHQYTENVHTVCCHIKERSHQQRTLYCH
ncbi:hypothetical protein O3M35_001437 [Rhynocoris fuscipes]|uniref:Uncharacterized protein n=1 Tax=Rhynocoris fuscipes TaxID=488301 RepID=A0AAW1CQ02_9HEMI